MSDTDTKRKPGRPRKETTAATAAPEPRQRPAMYETGEAPTTCLRCQSPDSTILNTWLSAGVRFRRRICRCGQHWISRVRSQ